MKLTKEHIGKSVSNNALYPGIKFMLKGADDNCVWISDGLMYRTLSNGGWDIEEEPKLPSKRIEEIREKHDGYIDLNLSRYEGIISFLDEQAKNARS